MRTAYARRLVYQSFLEGFHRNAPSILCFVPRLAVAEAPPHTGWPQARIAAPRHFSIATLMGRCARAVASLQAATVHLHLQDLQVAATPTSAN
jgi:hypothetical protein